MSAKLQHQVIIVGSGMVGMTLAAALTQQGVSVGLIEAHAPTFTWPQESLDARVSAINLASKRILQNLKLWSSIRPIAKSRLLKMAVWDGIGGGKIQFDAADINASELGFIIENRELVRVLWEHLQQDANATFYYPNKAATLKRHDSHIELCLNDQTALTAQLLVGADGGSSWVRRQMQTVVQEHPYHHDALVAVVQTSEPHQQTAYQNFLPQGPLGLLPMADPHQSAFVWSTEPEHANHLQALSSDAFNLELANSLESCLGDMQCLTSLKSIPLIMRHAKHYVEPRLAIIGDAAHTIHPLAGQGVNLGLMDAACLADTLIHAEQQQRDLGHLRPLREYERWRKCDNTLMLAAMRGFKALFAEHSPWVVYLRSQGLALTDQMGLVKAYFMRYAMGDVEDLPSLAKNNTAFG